MITHEVTWQLCPQPLRTPGCHSNRSYYTQDVTCSKMWNQWQDRKPVFVKLKLSIKDKKGKELHAKATYSDHLCDIWHFCSQNVVPYSLLGRRTISKPILRFALPCTNTRTFTRKRQQNMACLLMLSRCSSTKGHVCDRPAGGCQLRHLGAKLVTSFFRTFTYTSMGMCKKHLTVLSEPTWL